MKSDFQIVFNRLTDYCQSRNYAGYDPFDGLNSVLFQSFPVKHSRFFRLAWIQFCKRFPLNLRKLLLIKEGHNPKGLALFALGWMEIYQQKQDENAKNEALIILKMLVDLQISSKKDDKQIMAFGYNFDWQGRAFFAPQGTPTVVPTAFAAKAFLQAYKLFRDEKFLDYGMRICNFILLKLNRTFENEEEVCFSYSPSDMTKVFNASLLAGEVLAQVGRIVNDEKLKKEALRVARYVCRRQNSDGSWAYGDEKYQSWADNFHTAFNLTSLKIIAESCQTTEFNEVIKRGYEFWTENFFEPNGLPKYFHNRKLPIDCHSSGAAIATLCDFENFDLAKKVGFWTIENMFSEDGYFYYQKQKFYTVKIPYMRWTQSWMFYALAKFLNTEKGS